MAFNVAKCHVMHLGQHNPRNKYLMDGITLGTTECERDIGVLVTSNLKPTQQCKKGQPVQYWPRSPSHFIFVTGMCFSTCGGRLVPMESG